MHVLLISTYDMGRQPFGVASPTAWLRRAGCDVSTVDLSREPLRPEVVERAQLVAWHLPMHTATRLALPTIERVRGLSTFHLCCYGLYAPLNDRLLRSCGIDSVLGGEFEADLVALAQALRDEDAPIPESSAALPRLDFVVPDRRGLPPLSRYAGLIVGNDEPVTVGYTEASRGCKHLCRHCPVVPVYGGHFRVVPPDVVIADIDAQVEAGARHITFGDPDFFNGIRHALDVIDAVERRGLAVTYDVTIKIQHLLQYRQHLPRLRDTGCLFITTAVESVDDHVLEVLDKGHTRVEFEEVVALCREAGVTLAPTFVPFTPWTTLAGYCELLEAIESLALVEHVAPIQLAIRLLLPEGSLLMAQPDVREVAGPFERATLAYPWRHPDPRVDDLQRDVFDLVGRRQHASRCEVFEAIADLAYARAERPRRRTTVAQSRTVVPYLNEPWYC